MIAKNVSLGNAYKALEIVNQKYDNNILFKNLVDISSSRMQRIRFTLKVASSRNKGASRNPFSGRRSCAACWHVHGDFFDALLSVNALAEIQTALHGKHTIDKDGGNWQDYNVGSHAFPYYASDVCECNGEW